MKRPILIAVLGYTIGIIWGLYFNSIALFFILLVGNIFLLKNRKNQRKSKRGKVIARYQKLFLNTEVMAILAIFILLGNIIIANKKLEYEKIQQNKTQIEAKALVISSAKEKNYTTEYRIQILESSRNKIDEKKEFLIHIKKGKNQKRLEYGDIISFVGEYTPPEKQRNTGGFDDIQYCKSIGIYGRIQAKEVTVRKKGKGNFLKRIANQLASKIKEKLISVLPKEHANLVLGILLGQDDRLDNEIKQDFRDSSLSHILAVSGMHISYLLLGVITILEKTKCPKTVARTLAIGFLVFFTYLTNQTPSVERACIMSSLVLGAGLVYRKSDTITNLAFSLGVILLKNPFSILDRGLILSFLGTIGILVFSKKILTRLTKKDTQLQLIDHKTSTERLYLKIKEIMAVSIAAQVMIFPVSLYYFNTISLTFLASNILVSFLIGIIFCFSILVICIPYWLGFLFTACVTILNGVLTCLLAISYFFSSIRFSKIVVITPPIFLVYTYYVVLFSFYYITKLRGQPKKRVTKQKLFNWIEEILEQIHKHKVTIFLIVLVIVLVCMLGNSLPSELCIHFIDVGQGDATLIVTPYHKRILIDTGGSKNKEEFDVGASTLVPYLLDMGIKRIDYLCISHFDADHCNGALAVIEMLEVKEVVIATQFEDYENYQEFKKIVKEKRIKVHMVEAGQRIKIEKNLYFDILWPDSDDVISENGINNNSLVCKMIYQNFSCIFTGDIEEIAEKAILEKYKNTNVLQSTILKVAHHGSKSSSIQEFLNAVKPKIALIGVGEKNTFGHPNSGVLERIKEKRL